MSTHTAAREFDYTPFAILPGCAVAALQAEPSALYQATIVLFACATLLFAARHGRPPDTHRRSRLFMVVLIVLLTIPGIRDDLEDLADGDVRVWNVYHYYLGSKYFDELGYDGLYVATLAADREHHQRWTKHVRTVRNLSDYSLQPVQSALADYEPRDHFSPERWRQFRNDVDALRKHRRSSAWRDIFKDRGYNGTPVWTAIGGALANRIPADSPWLVALCSLDLVLLAGALGLLARAYGIGPVLGVLLLFVASPTNLNRLVGGFLQLDWLCAIIAAIALLRLRCFALAGAVLSYALMTRIFPVFMAAMFLLPFLPRLWRHGEWPIPAIRFAAGMFFGSLLLFGISVLPDEGFQRWPKFVDNISTHRTDHVLGERRVGLEHAFTRDWSQASTDIDKAERSEFLDERRVIFGASAVVLVLMSVFAALRLPTLAKSEGAADALLIGMIPVFALLVLSRYYFAILCLLPLLQAVAPRWRSGVIVGQLLIFAVFQLLASAGASWHLQYTALNVMLTIYFFAILVPMVRGTPFHSGTRPAAQVLQPAR